jgi:hypothetical protein
MNNTPPQELRSLKDAQQRFLKAQTAVFRIAINKFMIDKLSNSISEDHIRRNYGVLYVIAFLRNLDTIPPEIYRNEASIIRTHNQLMSTTNLDDGGKLALGVIGAEIGTCILEHFGKNSLKMNIHHTGALLRKCSDGKKILDTLQVLYSRLRNIITKDVPTNLSEVSKKFEGLNMRGNPIVNIRNIQKRFAGLNSNGNPLNVPLKKREAANAAANAAVKTELQKLYNENPDLLNNKNPPTRRRNRRKSRQRRNARKTRRSK